MNVRQPACEPCREAKVACNHERPACGRCRLRSQVDACVYRVRPFKRRRLQREPIGDDEIGLAPQSDTAPVDDPTPSIDTQQLHRYPNPGFLGPSSHSTIFDQVDSSTTPVTSTRHQHDISQRHTISPSKETLDDASAAENWVDTTVLRMLDRATILKLKGLVHTWLGSSVNLPLAGPFVSQCAQAAHAMADRNTLLASRPIDSSSWISDYAKELSKNTVKPLIVHKDTTPAGLLAQIIGPNTRWETLGILFTAASRAALDISLYPSLYTSESSRRKLIKLLTRVGDCCLETCLSLDCMNDLQLVLQYENFILNSQVIGDQNYLTWRKMGDLASSLFALGYNELSAEDTSDVPSFVLELRKSAMCRIYSVDKNLALFLGRPPRLTRPYCHLQLPVHLPGVWESDMQPCEDYYVNMGQTPEFYDDLCSDSINYTANTRCSAIFASIKEDILPFFRIRSLPHRIEPALALIAETDIQWDALPTKFKLQSSLKDCHKSPFERDFLAGVRLDYLHTRFLLHLVSQNQISEPSYSILEIASEMLSYVVELIVLRDKLVNAGTSLIWKVAHYGLPPAGIVSLALLKPAPTGENRALSRSKMLQNLSVLATEIRIGAVISPEDPDYALCARATSSIQSLLDKLVVGESMPILGATGPASEHTATTDAITQWDGWINSDTWDFEMDFWENLAEHPVLQDEGR